MVKARQWLLAQKPEGSPIIGGPDATFNLVEKDLPALKDDEILVKTLYLSNDPAQRGWISKYVDPMRLYAPAVQVGTPMHCRGLAQVIESKSDRYKEGETVVVSTGWSEYAVVPAKGAQPAPDLPGGLSKTQYLGALGMTGLTAYYGLVEVVHTTADDIVVISGAAGATGNMVVQIAKHIVGCKKVIGIAGSDEKCRWVESLGADVCLNYKSPSFKDDLVNATPGPAGFANVYFDNVGGEILDLMLTRMAKYGRVAACGSISNYNAAPDRTTGLKNWFEVVIMRLNIAGFIVTDYVPKFPEARQILIKAVEEGKLKIEGGEHVVKGGFEDVPKIWLQLFEGSNQGKLVTALQ